MFTSLFTLAALHVAFFILYIKNTGVFPKPLSAQKEQEYLKLCKDGDLTARNLLIEHNLRLVAHIVKKYYANMKDQDDLLSIGCIGLIKAIDSFDCEKGNRLATYAARCIENEVLMYFRNLKKTSCEISLNDAIETDGDGNALTLTDVLPCEDGVLESVEMKEHVTRLYQDLQEHLSSREQEILRLRYGLYNSPALTQREVAKRLNISRSYVSRLEKKALEKLRGEFEKPGQGY